MRVWRSTFPGAIALLALAPAAPDAHVPARPGLEAYFASKEPGVQTGGVRMVPIQTPRGTFKVWTKRFGNNPRIRLLLLHGDEREGQDLGQAHGCGASLQGSLDLGHGCGQG